MISRLKEFAVFVSDIKSTDRYIRYLNDISQTTGLDITPSSLKSESDLKKFTDHLEPKYAAKSIANYRSVMKKYIQMVAALNLKD
jgi:hypothetical protein